MMEYCKGSHEQYDNGEHDTTDILSLNEEDDAHNAWHGL